jgi:APA family basic amino acid/polyamine antiporter
VSTGQAATPPRLRRSLGFWQVTVTGVGIVIGAGIYVLIGEAAREAGAALWMSFLIAALLSVLTGLSYAELASMYPSAGAEYDYAREAFNEFSGFVTGWMMAATNIIAAAAVSIGFGHYVGYFVDIDHHVAAVGLLCVLTVIVASGIQRSIWLSVVLAVLQVGGLLLVIIAGAPHIGDRSLVEGASFAGVLSGAALVFFAFIGFDEVVTLAEETRDAPRVIPRALLAALGLSTALYVIVAIASVSVIDAGELAASSTPLTVVIAHNWGQRASDIVAVIALASTMNTTLLVMTTASRLIFGMSRSGSLPRMFSRVGRRTSAPYAAAVVVLVVAVCFATFSSIGRVAAVTDFGVYVIFIAVNVSLVTLRLRRPGVSRPFAVSVAIGRVPLTPVLGTATAVLMLAFLEPAAWLIGGAALASGAVAWAALRGPFAPGSR